MHGELVALGRDRGQERQDADGRRGGSEVEFPRAVVQVPGDRVAVPPQGREDVRGRRVAVGGGDPGVRGVDVGSLPAAAPRRGDQAVEGVVVVPDAEVHADLLGPPTGQPGGPVEVGGLRDGEEGVPRAEHQTLDDVTPCAREATSRHCTHAATRPRAPGPVHRTRRRPSGGRGRVAERSAGRGEREGKEGDDDALRGGDRPGHDQHALHPVRPRRPGRRRRTSASTEQIFPQPGWVEHDPIEIWRNAREVVGGALARGRRRRPSDIAAVGITNQRETTVVWDRAHRASRSTTRSSGRTRAPTAICDELGGRRRRRPLPRRDRPAARDVLRRARRSAGSSTTSTARASAAEARRAAVRHDRQLAALEPHRRPATAAARHRRHQRLAARC